MEDRPIAGCNSWLILFLFHRDALMSTIRAVLTVAAAMAAGGCSLHPLPENVTGVDSVIITRQIRCEARQTLVDMIKDWLTGQAKSGNARASRLLDEYSRDPDAISGFTYELFTEPHEIYNRSLVKIFYNSAIAYTFDLTMTEDNDLSAGVGFVQPINSRFTVGFGTGANRRRVNNRVFTMSDTFGGLLRINAPVRGVRFCDGHLVQANFAYPIAGRIGVDRVAEDFVRLTLFGNLGVKSDGPPTLTDKLTFTTVINASANPAVIFTPVTSAFQIASANLTASAVRSDVHQVTVSLAVDPLDIPDLRALREFFFSPNRNALTRRFAPVRPRRSSPSLEVGVRVIGSGSDAEKLAVIANDQAKSREVQFIAQ